MKKKILIGQSSFGQSNNKPILDIVGDQSVGRTNVSDLGSGQFDFTQQNVQQNELLTDTNKIVSPFAT